jgi:hypothetical protein
MSLDRCPFAIQVRDGDVEGNSGVAWSASSTVENWRRSAPRSG